MSATRVEARTFPLRDGRWRAVTRSEFRQASNAKSGHGYRTLVLACGHTKPLAASRTVPGRTLCKVCPRYFVADDHEVNR